MPDASFGTVFKSFRFHLSTLQTERFQTAPLSSFDKEKQTKSVSPDSWAKYQFIFLIDIVLGVALVRGYLNSIFFFVICHPCMNKGQTCTLKIIMVA